MWLKSHRWVDVPGTRTEKRWAMNVRESTHTAMVFDKKYLNVETGKFDTDKLCTLNSLSLNDLIDNYDPNELFGAYVRSPQRYITPKKTNVYNFPKHVPKDNDFDEECARDKKQRKIQESLKREKEEHEKRIKHAKELYNIKCKQEEQQRKEQIAIRNHALEEDARRSREWKIKQEEYMKQLAETEARLMKEQDERNERLKQAAYNRHVGNVRPNVWRPK